MTESIAESLRAGLALIAVVLLARANAGALTKGPSVWVGVPVCLLMWGVAAGAARWSRLSGGSRLSAWKDCVAPALVTLLIAGSGSSGSLAMGIGLVTIGTVAVGLATCCRVDSPTDSSEPIPEREGEAPAEPQRGECDISGARLSGSFALPVSAESDRLNEGGPPVGECTPLDTPAPDDVVVILLEDAAPTHLPEIVERRGVSDELPVERPPRSVPPGPGGPGYGAIPLTDRFTADDEPSPVESWTRTESDGEVSIEAVVLARFIEGSKLAVVHLPFVPPLPAVPQIECEPLDSGCEVMIKTEAAYRHGVRLSITRPSAGSAELVPIGVVVYTSAEEPVE